MFDFSNPENIGKEYKNFILISVEDLPDYKAKGIYLRHRTTGLEVYHVLKNDRENLFSFGFRTVSKNSKGTAHVIEHSTLCGSEKYPLKEPFTTLISQSLNTYLNALTYPDKTAYPASSLVKSDFFNIMDVYADSVFFPKLDYATFLQEGHRLEMDEKGKLSIQGVVYNEMKGEYSSFSQIAVDEFIASMYPQSYPAFDSGGDPLEIPALTYEDFCAFHQKFYSPDNCLLFLYGDIPTSETVDYLDEHFISRIEKKYGILKASEEELHSKLPLRNKEIAGLYQLNLHKKSQDFKMIAPVTGATGNMVTVGWYSGKDNMEKLFLSEVLTGNDSSPVSKALKDSELGDDLFCGNFGQYEEEIFTIGMFGVKNGNENKVYDLIHKVINELYEKGVKQEDVDAAIMGIDFGLREVNRYYGPFSLNLMSKVLKSWSFGQACSRFMNPISDFEKVKKNIAGDKDYVKKLIKKYLIEPEVQIKAVCKPSEEYFKNRNEKEEALIKKFSENLDREQLKKNLDSLHAYQQKIETPEEKNCIPRTKLNELNPEVDLLNIETSFVKGHDNSEIPLFVSNEETNGIFYMDVLFPYDRLSPEYYQYIPLLSDSIGSFGWNGGRWDLCIAKANCIAGDVWGRDINGSVSNNEYSRKFVEDFVKQYGHKEIFDRNWLAISVKALTEKADETLNLLSEIITGTDFTDAKRMKSLIQEDIADKKYCIVPSGRELAGRRARALLSKPNAIAEILSGVTQLKTTAYYKKAKPENVLKKFRYIYDECRNSGAIFHITCDDESLKKIKPLLEDFAAKSHLTKLLPSKNYGLKDLVPYIYKAENISKTHFSEVIKLDTNTGYGVTVVPAAPDLTKMAAAQYVFASWFDVHTLWDKIRTTGGAYGASASPNSKNENFSLSSYRDPSPEKSVDIFEECIKNAASITIPDEDIERAIVSAYGDSIVPMSPKDRGKSAFEGFLYADYHTKKIKVSDILNLKPEDVREYLKWFSKVCDTFCHKVIFCDKSTKCSGKKLKMPL